MLSMVFDVFSHEKRLKIKIPSDIVNVTTTNNSQMGVFYNYVRQS